MTRADGFCLVGAGLVAWGLYSFWSPAAFLWLGVLAIGIGVTLRKQTEGSKK